MSKSDEVKFNLDDLRGHFSWLDYTICGLLLLVSCSGGLWYSAVGSRNKNVKDVRDYLLGGKKMSTFPVSLSLIASYISGVTVLGTPGEIYNYGLEYFLVIVSVFTSGFTVVRVYLPVFCTLKVSSSYEYLELRFNKHVRAAASILFLMDEILFLPMVIYVPALACQQLTGLSMHLVSCMMVLVCGLYTVLGGLRAVVWTDSIQTAIMFGGVLVAAVAGTISAGGPSNIWQTASDNGRLSLQNWSFSPYERQSGWAAIVGSYFYWTCFNSVNQTMVQRYLALPNQRQAIIAVMLFCFGAALSLLLCVWSGLSAFVAWVMSGCEQSAAPPIDDRVLPAFVTYVAKKENMKGLPGVFLAGVFGAGLSSLSAILNACSLVGVEDLAHGVCDVRMSAFKEGLLARAISTALAVLSLLMIFVVERLGGILSVAVTLSAIASSTTCGVFTLGMCCWWVGKRGALCGAVAGASVAGLIAAGSSVASASGYRFPPVPVPQSSCPTNVTWTPKLRGEDVFPLFKLSFHWTAPLGLLTTLVVGAIAGWRLDRGMPPVHPTLISPVVYRWLPDKCWELSPYLRRKHHEGMDSQGTILLPKERRMSEVSASSRRAAGGPAPAPSAASVMPSPSPSPSPSSSAPPQPPQDPKSR